jgi:integrase/recombinase XerD
MEKTEVNRFNTLYQHHLRLLKLQGKSQKTIDAYSRAVRRVRDHFDCCPDQLTPEQLETYFGELVDTHSWSTVKIDRNGLQFFWRYVLKRDWQWINIIKPPRIHTIPDILTPVEIERLIGKTRWKAHTRLGGSEHSIRKHAGSPACLGLTRHSADAQYRPSQ